ncbi:hypothetical protein ABNF97_16705 [Plantactinospora sp. B6F1]|uniref:WD40/YVTN/BNR-like repeat-containing protein n=1 Tax=Plantactinospora sp. B6F1 TaxID=3158971 RepID=UPI0032D90536
MPVSELAGFDVDTVSDAVRQPPLDDLRSVAQARRRRRAGGLALALVVVLAGMVALPLATNRGAAEWGDPTLPPQTRVRSTELFMTGPDSGVGVETVDHGCTLRFAYTTDGGRSWTRWDQARYRSADCSPGATPGSDLDLRFSVLGERSYLVFDGGKSRLSTDYGRTWQDAEHAMMAVSAFPPRARSVFCQDGCDAVRQPLAVDPSTGTVYRLSGAQPSPYPPSSIYPSADGTIWVTYWPGDIDVMVVARSADRGATWNTWRPAKGADVIAVAGVSKREAYLLIEPPPPPGAQPMERDRPSQLLQTTDGGVTWQDAGTDLPASPANRLFTIGSDGSLLVAESGALASVLTSSLWVSRDRGRHFSNQHGPGGKEGSVGVAPGHAWLYGRDDISAVGPDHALITEDGLSWSRFALPE